MGNTEKGRLPITGRLSSPFGWRTHPVLGTRKFHNGVDIASPTGTPLPAIWAGKVMAAGMSGAGGNTVTIDAGADGQGRRISYSYCHLHTIAVKPGQQVKAGALVGTVGSTGRSTGPHLHFTLRVNGEAVDPLQFTWSEAKPPARLEAHLVVNTERLAGEILEGRLFVPARRACILLGLPCVYVQAASGLQFGGKYIVGPLIGSTLYVPARELCDQAACRSITWKADKKELLVAI